MSNEIDLKKIMNSAKEQIYKETLEQIKDLNQEIKMIKSGFEYISDGEPKRRMQQSISEKEWMKGMLKQQIKYFEIGDKVYSPMYERKEKEVLEVDYENELLYLGEKCSTGLCGDKHYTSFKDSILITKSLDYGKV